MGTIFVRWIILEIKPRSLDILIHSAVQCLKKKKRAEMYYFCTVCSIRKIAACKRSEKIPYFT